MPNVVKGTFETLNSIDVNEHTEKKKSGGAELTYLSWAWAWGELKKVYPEAVYNIKKFGENNLPYVYDENTGYMVFTDMTINGITHEMWLPVMDGANKAMKKEPYKYMTKYNGEKTVDSADMFDINKTIMRCLVKNIAMFGLGLYIFAGEDLPESVEEPTGNDEPEVPTLKTQKETAKKQFAKKVEESAKVEEVAKPIENKDELITVESRTEIIKLLTTKGLDIPSSMTKIAEKLGVNKALIKESHKEEIIKLIEGGIE